MPTQPYFDGRGNRLPSVTQVLSASWAKGDALVQWAWTQGKNGQDWKQVRDDAGTIGTIAHELVLSKIGGAAPQEWAPSELRAARVPAHHAAGWMDGHTFEPLVVEEALVSGKLGYGGTPDWYGIMDGVPTLLDIKTSARPYVSHYVQLAAYIKLLEERGHKVDRAGILILPKQMAGHPRWEQMEGVQIDRMKAAWDAVFNLYKIQVIIGF
jgi:hypothetical protein